VLATTDQLKCLATKLCWYIDGTFEIVIAPFKQLMSIHAYIKTGESKKQIPLAFAIMSRRTIEDYTVVLETIKKKIIEITGNGKCISIPRYLI